MENLKYYNPKGMSGKEKSDYITICHFTNEQIDNEKSKSYKLGYEVFGALLVGMCQWLHQNFNQNNINNVYFLSRDGYILKKAYEILYPENQVQYLYVSRKSLALPSMMGYSNLNEILEAMVLPPVFTIKELLKCLDINCIEIEDIIKLCDINYDDIFYRKSFRFDAKLKKLISTIEPMLREKITQQNDLFVNYLKQEHFENKVAIVDIGWHNSIQKYFTKIIDNNKLDIEIHGYYIGVYNNAAKFDKGSEAKGFLYEYGDNMNIQYQTFAFVSLFESMFLAHEGTTLGYDYLNDQYIPVVAEYEYRDNQKIKNIIFEYQNGALQFVRDFKENEVLSTMNLSPLVASKSLINFGLNPQKEDVEIFENVFFENFSNNNMINYNHKFCYYITHLNILKEDFFKSGWRIMFLKRLIQVPFPHFLFFKILCKLFVK